MTLAPVIIFAYNRPDHLRKTLNWLGQNELADQSTLYIFCDGAKPNATDDQLAKVQTARQVAHKVAVVPTFKEVHIIERKENLGLGTSVITGVTEIVNKYGKVIVLEDCCGSADELGHDLSIKMMEDMGCQISTLETEVMRLAGSCSRQVLDAVKNILFT